MYTLLQTYRQGEAAARIHAGSGCEWKVEGEREGSGGYAGVPSTGTEPQEENLSGER